MALGTYIDLYVIFADGHYTTTYFRGMVIMQQPILQNPGASGLALCAAFVPQAGGPMSGRAAHCMAPRNRPPPGCRIRRRRCLWHRRVAPRTHCCSGTWATAPGPLVWVALGVRLAGCIMTFSPTTYFSVWAEFCMCATPKATGPTAIRNRRIRFRRFRAHWGLSWGWLWRSWE